MFTDNRYTKRLKERLRQDPKSILFLSFAEELRKRDFMDEAFGALKEGIRKNPDYLAARLALGRWYRYNDMLPEARQVYSEIAGLSPENFYAHKHLGDIKNTLKDHVGAVAEYKKALDIVPGEEKVSLALAALATSVEYEMPLTEEAADSGLDQSRLPAMTTAEIENESEDSSPFVYESEPKTQGPIHASPVMEIEAVSPGSSEEEHPLSHQAYTLEDAERFVAEGINKAMAVYKDLLLEDPNDETVLNKKAELEEVIRLLGRDRKDLTLKLNRFLDRVHARFQTADRQTLLNRLNRFLEALNSRFEPKKTTPEEVLGRLNRLSTEIQKRFIPVKKRDKQQTLDRLTALSSAIQGRFTAAPQGA